MNWVGGARNRVKFQGDRRVQKEFFERKKLDRKCEKVQRSTACHLSVKKKRHISQDLVALRTVSNASLKVTGNPVQNVKQVDLEKRPSHPVGKHSRAIMGKHNTTTYMRCGTAVELPFSPELAPSKLEFLEAEKPTSSMAALPASKPVYTNHTLTALPVNKPSYNNFPVAALPVSKSSYTNLPVAALPVNKSSHTNLPVAALPVNKSSYTNRPVAALPVNKSSHTNLSVAALAANKSSYTNLPVAALPVNKSSCTNLPVAALALSSPLYTRPPMAAPPMTRTENENASREIITNSYWHAACNSNQWKQRDSVDISRFAHSTFSQMPIDPKNTRITFSSLEGTSERPDIFYHDKWSLMKNPWITEDFQVSPPIPADTVEVSLPTPYLSFIPHKPESAKRRAHTERYGCQIPPASHYSNPDTPSPDLWKRKRSDMSGNVQCWSASRLHDMTASSPQLHRPWSLSDSEINSGTIIKTEDDNRSRAFRYGKLSGHLYSENVDPTLMMRKKQSDMIRTFLDSQPYLVPDKDRKFEWDNVFLSQPVSASTSLSHQSIQPQRQDTDLIEIGVCVQRTSQKSPLPAQSRRWTRKETQVAEVLLELDQLERQSHHGHKGHSSLPSNSCTPKPADSPMNGTFTNKSACGMESDTDITVHGVVEELVHNTVLSYDYMEHTTPRRSQHIQPKAAKDNEEDALRSINPSVHAGTSNVYSTGGFMSKRDKTKTDVSVDVAIQTDLKLTDMEIRDKILEGKQSTVDIGVQWEAHTGTHSNGDSTELDFQKPEFSCTSDYVHEDTLVSPAATQTCQEVQGFDVCIIINSEKTVASQATSISVQQTSQGKDTLALSEPEPQVICARQGGDNGQQQQIESHDASVVFSLDSKDALMELSENVSSKPDIKVEASAVLESGSQRAALEAVTENMLFSVGEGKTEE